MNPEQMRLSADKDQATAATRETLASLTFDDLQAMGAIGSRMGESRDRLTRLAGVVVCLATGDECARRAGVE